MVIQRWQSVMLLICGVMMGLFTFLSLGQVQLPTATLNFTTIGFSVEGISTDGGVSGCYMHTWPLFLLSILCMVIPIINIFLFKNLKLQRSLCSVEALFIVALAIVAVVYGYFTFRPVAVSWSSIICAPFIAIIADFMAYRMIKSDHEKIKSIDRIR